MVHSRGHRGSAYLSACLNFTPHSLTLLPQPEYAAFSYKGLKVLDVLILSCPTWSPYQVFIESLEWRYALKPGDEIDARDEDNAWYDSRVVEFIIEDGAPAVKVRVFTVAGRGSGARVC